MTDTPPSATRIGAFVSRWRAASGTERANYQLFIGELCALLGCPTPDPARDDTRDNAYVFERRVQFAHGDGSTSLGFIDCYRRNAFVLEAKKLKLAAAASGARPLGKTFDDALLRARAQAESYARALPAAEGRPPFLLVCCPAASTCIGRSRRAASSKAARYMSSQLASRNFRFRTSPINPTSPLKSPPSPKNSTPTASASKPPTPPSR